MTSSCSYKADRKNFGRITRAVSMPNLIELQKTSYENFLQIGVEPEKRLNKGLHEVFKSVFPVNDPSGLATLEYIKYDFDSSKYDLEECRQRGISYACPLKVTFRLIVWDIDEDTGSREIKSVKEQDVYLGEIPLMTENGTFVINGTERVIVSQMHRSPGVFFDHDFGKSHSSGKYLYSARIIPYRGSWLDFEFDAKDLLYFRVDRKRKLPITTLLRALGMSSEEILDTFYDKQKFKKTKYGWSTKFNSIKYKNVKLKYNLVNAKDGKVVVESGTKLTPRMINKIIQEGLNEQIISSDEIEGQFIAHDLINNDTGEVYFEIGDELKNESLALIDSIGVKEFDLLYIDNVTVGAYIRNTLFADKNSSKEEALLDIYRVIRPGEVPTPDVAEALLNSLFFDYEKYDLSAVGRVKINAQLGIEKDEDFTILSKEDITKIIKKLTSLKDGIGEVDDIDHLSNRRVRPVGELIENQFRIGMVRTQRSIIEKITSAEIDSAMPHDLINSKLLVTVIREFFGTSQLSQFMDQTNPLSEITHKRRLSALGPGGLSRDRASFEVRDVHTSHYGRICPIETPEGQNIGLINSLATFARVNKYGFIESPYCRVKDGKVIDEVIYLSAIEEAKYTIAQANVETDKTGYIINNLVSARRNGDFLIAPREEIDFIDVSPMQLVSVAASLIPFLENDDANRALMGSNMQRQAVPLVYSEYPLVGTGIEDVVARDSGATVIAQNSGIVDQVDSSRIVLKSDSKIEEGSPGVDVYTLLKYQRSNHNTCINQKPLVKVGDYIEKGQVIADGPCTYKGELALGKNVLVAFMSWNGYNFEDSILISERIVKDDVFTSVHIEEYELIARDTRLGPEEITRDIPNVSEQGLTHLDETGIVHIGAEVKAGDILVGKVTPKSESPMTPEEKLLRAIFGEKAADVRDSSLYVPPGVAGRVVEVRVYSRRGVEKDERALAIERHEIERLTKDKDDELSIISKFIYGRLENILIGKKVISGPKGLKPGTEITEEKLSDYTKGQWWQFVLEDATSMAEIELLKRHLDDATNRLNKKLSTKIEKLKAGDDLPQGALKVVKVFIATKQKLQPGDKMAGRHGNKGVVSKIVPVEDMPYLEDGTVIDIILNPLGLPSRMNVGQILETHLGAASVGLGKQIAKSIDEYHKNKLKSDVIRNEIQEIYGKDSKISKTIDNMDDSKLIEYAQILSKGIPFATPVFDGAKEKDIEEMLERAGLNKSGQTRLIDGRTGDYFDRDVTVGYIYMLKLHHLVDDKIHARSIGPYSLVTQQPLGGKSHFGGQRFGEMECWALQAYGASYTLQEMLTVKSDDVVGRVKIYESIVRGDNNFDTGVPESFNVMIKELRSLCLNVELLESAE